MQPTARSIVVLPKTIENMGGENKTRYKLQTYIKGKIEQVCVLVTISFAFFFPSLAFHMHQASCHHLVGVNCCAKNSSSYFSWSPWIAGTIVLLNSKFKLHSSDKLSCDDWWHKVNFPVSSCNSVSSCIPASSCIPVTSCIPVVKLNFSNDLLAKVNRAKMASYCCHFSHKNYTRFLNPKKLVLCP